MSTYCFDIDGVLCTNSDGIYLKAKPIQENIDILNELYDAGHKIILLTARGTKTGLDWGKFTAEQMKGWGVKYHELMMGKPEADFFVDDKGVTLNEIRAKDMPCRDN